MDYSRTTLRNLERHHANLNTQIAAVARAARVCEGTDHHPNLTGVLRLLQQDRVETAYWIRVKSGKVKDGDNGHH